MKKSKNNKNLKPNNNKKPIINKILNLVIKEPTLLIFLDIHSKKLILYLYLL